MTDLLATYRLGLLRVSRKLTAATKAMVEAERVITRQRDGLAAIRKLAMTLPPTADRETQALLYQIATACDAAMKPVPPAHVSFTPTQKEAV